MVATTGARALTTSVINDNTSADITPADIRSVLTSTHSAIDAANPASAVIEHNASAGNGSTDARAAIVSAMAEGALRFTAGTYRVASNLTITVPVTFHPGALLSPDSGATVTFSAPITAPRAQIFTGAGTIVGLTQDVRPEWWGAVRDGTADDSTPINKALACVGASGGGSVLLSRGDYKISSQLVIGSSNVALNGAGRRATRLLNPSLTTNTISVSANQTYWSVRDLTIISTQTAVDGSVKTTAGAGITCEQAQLGVIERIDINGAYNGIVLGNSFGTHVRSFEIDKSPANGILINGNCNDVYIRDGILGGAFNGVAGVGNAGLRLTNKVEALFCTSLEILMFDYAMIMDGQGATTTLAPAFNVFEMCFFDSCRSGVSINNSRGNRFTDCWFSNRPGHGCIIANSIDNSFTNCSFINSDLHGCLVQASATRTRFNGCTFDNNSQASSGTYSGVMFAAGTTDFIVSGCSAGNTGRFPATQGSAITVASGSSNRYIIADNLVSGNTGTAVVDGGSGGNKRVANNY